MKTDNLRACIYPKDIQLVMGKDYKPARLYLKKVKEHYKKEAHQVVTIAEFSAYSGIPVETVRRFII